MRPAVDVVVVTYGTAALTVSALRSLLDTDQGVDVHVFVHDNASPDDTVERLAREVPEASVVVGGSNEGFAVGVNAAVLRTSAPWVLVLNSDAWPAPGALRLLVDDLVAHPLAGLSAPRLESPSGEHEESVFAFPSVVSAARAGLLLTRPLGEGPVDWAVGAAWMLRREALVPLDESLFLYGEDVDLCWQLHERGWQVRYVPAAVVVHVGKGSGDAGAARTRAWIRNDVLLYPRWGRSVLAYRVVRFLGARRAARLALGRGALDSAAHWATVASAYRSPGNQF